jgi:hypothetical protein
MLGILKFRKAKSQGSPMTTIVAKVIIDGLEDSIKMREKINQYLADSKSQEHIKTVSDDQTKFLISLLILFKRVY